MPNGPFLEACDKPPVVEVEEAAVEVPVEVVEEPVFGHVFIEPEVVEEPVVEPPAKKKGGRKKKGE